MSEYKLVTKEDWESCTLYDFRPLFLRLLAEREAYREVAFRHLVEIEYLKERCDEMNNVYWNKVDAEAIKILEKK